MADTFDPYHRWLGIAPKDQPPHHYRLLAIDLFESDAEVIRDAVEQRIAHVRTYQLGEHVALTQKILNELSRAKACLLSPEKKTKYDAQLRQQLGQRQAPPSASEPPPAQESIATPPVQHSAPIDGAATFVSEITSGAVPSASPRARPQPRRRHVPFLAVLVAGLSVCLLVAMIVAFHFASKSAVHPEVAARSVSARESSPQPPREAVAQSKPPTQPPSDVARTPQEPTGAATRPQAPVPVPKPPEPVHPQPAEQPAPPTVVAKPLHLEPIAPQELEIGGSLTVVVSAQDAESWRGNLRFSLGPNCPSEAHIGTQTGTFTWTPSENQKPGKFLFPVLVEGPEGQRVETSLYVVLTQPKLPEVQETTVDLGGAVRLVLVRIPAGSFMMGDDSNASAQPAHQVTIKNPFWLGKYEVTQEQWQAVVGRNTSDFRGWKDPAENISWNQCQGFIHQLNKRVPGHEFRLPTEAEWEYACRAGGRGRYGFGDDESQLAKYAWYSSNSDGHPHPVGWKKPNPWGLYDMHGNVAEWCQDRYGADYYQHSPAEDPPGPATGLQRVVRGGDWCGLPMDAQSAQRNHVKADERNNHLGLRIVMNHEP
jgi:formylglycine-generating enzyme required for sulfatase activity